MAAEWFAKVMGEVLGPMSAADLVAMLRQKQLSPDDLVRKGQGDWTPARNVKGLLEKANSGAPAYAAKPPVKNQSASAGLTIKSPNQVLLIVGAAVAGVLFLCCGGPCIVSALIPNSGDERRVAEAEPADVETDAQPPAEDRATQDNAPADDDKPSFLADIKQAWKDSAERRAQLREEREQQRAEEQRIREAELELRRQEQERLQAEQERLDEGNPATEPAVDLRLTADEITLATATILSANPTMKDSDVAIVQDEDLPQFVIVVVVVGAATNEGEAKRIGENAVRSCKGVFRNDPSPERDIGKGQYTYHVTVATPQERTLAFGRKVYNATAIRWDR